MYRVITLLFLLSHSQSVTFANTDATLAPNLYYHPLKISDNATVVTTQYGPNLHMPIDIIQLIIIYKTGGIVYNYSQRFEEFTNNAIRPICVITISTKPPTTQMVSYFYGSLI